MLTNVVKATGGEPYPTGEVLHEALKMALGYVRFIRHIDGRMTAIPDSTAFASMDQAQFREYFDAAVKTLAERFGFDPLAMENAA
jgi:hypothetical protein